MKLRAAPLLFALSMAACSRRADPPRDAAPTASLTHAPAAPSVSAPPASPRASEATPSLPPCRGKPRITEPTVGLVVERVRASERSPVAGADPCITLVRIDPAHYRFTLLTAKTHGGDRKVTEWLRKFGLTGVINASMYGTDRRSVGLMIDGDDVNNGHDSEKFGGFLAFGATERTTAAVTLLGRSCPGFDLTGLRKRYKTVIQNYRLLDCEGRAIPWKDEKVFSAAAIGEDKRGRVVFIHARAPYSMTAFASMLAAPELELRSAHYVEGGPEASLLVEAGGTRVREMGSYETGFHPDDKNDEFWAIPNVVGFLPKGP